LSFEGGQIKQLGLVFATAYSTAGFIELIKKTAQIAPTLTLKTVAF
jgi:hypothetical protein